VRAQQQHDRARDPPAARCRVAPRLSHGTVAAAQRISGSSADDHKGQWL
jgi:hypothetical protein